MFCTLEHLVFQKRSSVAWNKLDLAFFRFSKTIRRIQSLIGLKLQRLCQMIIWPYAYPTHGSENFPLIELLRQQPFRLILDEIFDFMRDLIRFTFNPVSRYFLHIRGRSLSELGLLPLLIPLSPSMDVEELILVLPIFDLHSYLVEVVIIIV